MLKKVLICCAAGVLMASTTTFAADKAAAEDAIADAKSAQEAAKAVSGEWRDTAKMLDGAEKALASGDFDKAVKLAGDAKFQYEAGAAQMKEQQGIGNPGYLK